MDNSSFRSIVRGTSLLATEASQGVIEFLNEKVLLSWRILMENRDEFLDKCKSGNFYYFLSSGLLNQNFITIVFVVR